MQYNRIMTFLALAMLAAGCTQEALDPQDGENGQGSVTVDHIEWVPLSLEGEATRISIDNTTGVPSWTTGDQVAVHTTSGSYQTCTVDVAGNTVPVSLGSNEERDGFAVYPATAVANNSTSLVQVTYPDSYDLSSYSEAALATLTEAPCPMVAINTPGSALKFRHVGGIIRITLQNVPAGTKSIDVKVTGDPVTGTATVSNPGRTDATCSIASGGNTVSFTLATSLSADRTVTLNIPAPSGSFSRFELYLRDSQGILVLPELSSSYSGIIGHRTGIKFIYQNDAIGFGPFSVAADRQVYFSPGNLQYIGSAEVPYWKFADHQWEALGTTTGQNSDATNVDRDLFGWGTGDAPNKVSKSDDDYAVFTDWGTNFITNGGPFTWRTLTGDEWIYLLNHRTCSPKFAGATVAGVTGLIMFPDNYIHPAGVASINSVDDYHIPFDSNTFDASAWSVLELAGCIFLPATGLRNGVKFEEMREDSGRSGYWGSDLHQFGDPYCLYFIDGIVEIYIDGPYMGYYVRLVRDIN